ncbi:hypothetical protein V8D89_004671 [Ganoderma adspersum]
MFRSALMIVALDLGWIPNDLQSDSKEYWHYCLTCYNLDRPFAHNCMSDQWHLNKYVEVFRKTFATDMPCEPYNKYVELGLFNLDHVIGQLYTLKESEFVRVRVKRMVPVYAYADLDSDAENPYKFYTVIHARCPDSWGMGWNASVLQRCPGDARLPGFPPVFGPASSPSNQLDVRVFFTPGRMCKVGPSPR